MRKAIVKIDRPARYAKQLASHLGHKLTVAAVAGGWSIKIDGALGGVLVTGDSELTLTAKGDTDELTERMQYILQKHLHKFAGDLEPVITWN